MKFLPSEDYRIVVITQGGLRHRRFALRIQEAFGSQVVGWFAVGGGSKTGSSGGRLAGLVGKLRRAAAMVLSKDGIESLNQAKRGSVLHRLKAVYRAVRYSAKQVDLLRVGRMKQAGIDRAEKRIIAPDMARLQTHQVVEPQKFADPTSDEFVAVVKNLKPYFILTLGGPLYPKALLECATGAAINQHAGWAPEYKGNATVYWALYHRSLAFLGSTVHLLTTGADAGPILRRGNPTLLPEDSPFDCFIRVVVLGNELMIDAVREIIREKRVEAESQVPGEGRTYLSKEFTPALMKQVCRDFRAGWLAQEMRRFKSS